MKKLSIILLMCVFVATGKMDLASAEEGKFTAVIGYKGWFNQWLTGTLNNDTTNGANVSTFTSDYEYTSIPVISLRYDNLFVSGSYYMPTKFSFPDTSYRITYTTVGTITETAKTTAEREEWDTSIGYYVHPSIGLTVGYKNIKQEYTTTLRSPGIVYTPATTKSTTTIKGPTVGITGGYPLGSGFGAYYAFSYGWLESSYEGVSRTDDSSYRLTDIGFSFKPGTAPLAFTLGYRSQLIDTKFPTNLGEQIGPDDTKGFVLGANLIF
ncbi:MAG: hypothetical protein Q8P28_02650 [Deltaproteobacteria bacterium]|nr:hypothetical protein [Deltaproteobacteria bacterium]